MVCSQIWVWHSFMKVFDSHIPTTSYITFISIFPVLVVRSWFLMLRSLTYGSLAVRSAPLFDLPLEAWEWQQRFATCRSMCRQADFHMGFSIVMVVPQNGWLRLENPIKMDVWGYPYFRKPLSVGNRSTAHQRKFKRWPTKSSNIAVEPTAAIKPPNVEVMSSTQ